MKQASGLIVAGLFRHEIQAEFNIWPAAMAVCLLTGEPC